MALINLPTSARGRSVQLGFKTSIIALFVAIVLVIGLTLVYLSFSRITAVTDSAASQFIGKAAELSADRIGSQLKLVRDNLKVLNALPSVQSAQIEGAAAARDVRIPVPQRRSNQPKGLCRGVRNLRIAMRTRRWRCQGLRILS